jgi:LmbE family N-acetylglucosaminyl deacetylase
LEAVPEGFTRVLVVGAHPDDAEFFAGATLARLARTARVELVVCTGGERGGRGLTDAGAVRREEQAEAARVLGLAAVHPLGFEDGGLEPGPTLRSALVPHLRRLRPELVLGHDPRTLWTPVGPRTELGHSDHRAAGQALLDAIYPRAASPNFQPGAGLPWCPRELWLFDTASPDLRLDVAESWDTKLEALRAHASQEAVAGGLTGPAEALARHFGEPDRPAEAFVRLRIW